MTWLLLYVLGYVVSWLFIVGWIFADQTDLSSPIYSDKFRREMQASHAGFSVAWTTICCFLWPAFLPMAYCMTGFACKGWRFPTTKPYGLMEGITR